MQVEFLSSFEKDITKLSSPTTRQALKKIILKIEDAQSLSQVSQIKKLVGYTNAYRIVQVITELVFFYENNVIQLARIAHRKDIYKIFP